MTDQDLLPIFPLNTVLFPGQLLPLHIFEERYQIMVKECLKGDAVFGVALIREETEVGQTAVPFDVGTVARIRRVDQTHEDKINLICLGEARFKITTLNYDHPYLAAQIEIWPWHPLQQGEVEPRSSILKGLLTRYLKVLANLSKTKVELENLPGDPLMVADLAAIALQISNHEKQRLLSEPGQAEFIDSCISLLRRETLSMERLASLPMVMDDKPPSFSAN